MDYVLEQVRARLGRGERPAPDWCEALGDLADAGLLEDAVRVGAEVILGCWSAPAGE